MGADKKSNLQKCGEILINIKAKNKKTKIYTFNCSLCNTNYEQLKKFSMHIEQKHFQKFTEESIELVEIFEPEKKLERNLEVVAENVLSTAIISKSMEVYKDPLESSELVDTEANIEESVVVKIKVEDELHCNDPHRDYYNLNNEEMDYEDCVEDNDEDYTPSKKRSKKIYEDNESCSRSTDASSDDSNDEIFTVKMSEFIFESDFIGDDCIKNSDFRPSTIKRKMSLLDESGPSIKKFCGNSPSDRRKIIFKGEFYTEVQKISDKTTCAKCVVCHRVIKGSGEVTSNFIKHLQVKHSELFKKYKSYKAGSPFGGKAQSVFHGKLLHAIIDSSLPLSILEKKSFIELFENTGMKVLSRQTAAIKLEEKYTAMVRNIKEEILSSKYFCTTTDIWSENHRSFLGYTCHWLTDNLERKSAALACSRIFGVHNAENIAQMITEINTTFGLNSSKIVLTVTDNGSNFVKAFRDYGVGNNFFEDEINDDLPVFDNERWLPTHQRCCSYALNLLASTDFDKILKNDQPLYIQHRMTFDKCNNLWKECKWPKSSEIIEEHLGSSLLLPVATRWNSLYDAVQKLLCYKEKLNNLCDKLTLPHFSPADLQYLDMYKLIMEPIAKAVDFLQGENNINYGFLIPTLVTLSNRLHKLSRVQELQQISSVILKMEQRLRERFQPYFMLQPESSIALAATVLTQSVKMKWLKVLQRLSPELPELTVENITSRVLDTLYSFYAKNCNTFNFEIKNNNLSNMPDFFDFNNDDDEIETSLSPQDRRSTIKHQFFSYLNDNSSADEIWQKYYLLKEAFIFFNTPLTSSAPVEGLFSFAGIVNSPRRQSLSDFSFEKLVLMKANSKYI